MNAIYADAFKASELTEYTQHISASKDTKTEI